MQARRSDVVCGDRRITSRSPGGALRGEKLGRSCQADQPWHRIGELRHAEQSSVRIVDPETCSGTAAGTVGEIWTQGENVALGYWNKPDETAQTFGGRLADPAPDVSDNQWLRTGDLGFISEGEMFIIGRMKDLLIVRGRNIYPDDVEATVSMISSGRTAAIADPLSDVEQLVVVVELKRRQRRTTNSPTASNC